MDSTQSPLNFKINQKTTYKPTEYKFKLSSSRSLQQQIIDKVLSAEDDKKRLIGKNYRFLLEIDHIKSANICKQNNNNNSSPPYGLWKRIYDFIVDAALCFPEKIIDGNFMSLNVIGGCYKGKWSENLKRFFSGRTDNIDQKIVNYPVDIRNSRLI